MRYRKIRPFQPDETETADHRRKFLFLALHFLWVFAVYYITVIRMQWKAALFVFLGVLTLLLCGVLYCNRGLSGKLPEWDDLPSSMTDAQKMAWMDRRKRDHRIAQRLMLVLFPMILTLGIDIIYMNFFTK